MKFQNLPQGVYSLSPTPTLTLQTLVMCRLQGGLYRQGTPVFHVRWVMLERPLRRELWRLYNVQITERWEFIGCEEGGIANERYAGTGCKGAHPHQTQGRLGSSRSQRAFARHKQSY